MHRRWLLAHHPEQPEHVANAKLLCESAVISGHQRSSVVISGHQWSSAVISGHQRSSAVISGHQRSSGLLCESAIAKITQREAIRGTERGHQRHLEMHSDAIRGT